MSASLESRQMYLLLFLEIMIFIIQDKNYYKSNPKPIVTYSNTLHWQIWMGILCKKYLFFEISNQLALHRHFTSDNILKHIIVL